MKSNKILNYVSFLSVFLIVSGGVAVAQDITVQPQTGLGAPTVSLQPLEPQPENNEPSQEEPVSVEMQSELMSKVVAMPMPVNEGEETRGHAACRAFNHIDQCIPEHKNLPRIKAALWNICEMQREEASWEEILSEYPQLKEHKKKIRKKIKQCKQRLRAESEGEE